MEGGSRRSGDLLAGLTLGAVLGNEKETPPLQVNRTLLDIIRAEEPNSVAYKNLIDHHHSKKSWKSLKDRLRLKRAGAAWAAVASSSLDTDSTVASENNQHPPLAQLLRIHSVRMVEPAHEDHQFGELLQAETSQVQLLNRSLSRVVSLRTDLTQEDSFHVEQVPVSDVPVINNLSSMLRLNSSLSGQSDEPVRSLRLSEALAAEREQIQRVVSSNEAVGSAQGEEEVSDSANDNRERDAVDEHQQVRMSLMDLLEETDRQMGLSSYTGDVDDDEECKSAEKEGCNLVERNCCVCMVRDKGAAFIPCGHTFCRLCSRELWVNRGNCPLCNGFILEILDIF